jgi:uncharacterized protein (TIGR03083 family)
MDPATMLAQLTTDARALRDAARDLDAAVPTCPGWTVRDAVEHTALVYAHKSAVLEQGVVDGEPDWPPAGLRRDDVLELFDEQLHRLLEALRTRDPATRAGSWYEPDQTVGFWVRRMMHETAVHRADVEASHGGVTPVGDEVGLDGIDELVECFLRYDTWHYAEAPGAGERVAIRADGAAWTVTLGPDAATYVREGGAADAEIAGAPGEVYLALWNRLPYDRVSTRGDAAALAALRAALAAVTQ